LHTWEEVLEKEGSVQKGKDLDRSKTKEEEPGRGWSEMSMVERF